MNADKIDVEGLLLDESFINYCMKSSQDDVAYWENYVKHHPEHIDILENARAAFGQLYDALATKDLAEQVAKLEHKISLPGSAAVVSIDRPTGKRLQRKLVFKIAAAIAFLISVGGMLYWQFNRSGHGDFKIFEAAYGERKSVQLPDGSLVMLNAGSIIKIKEDFGVTSRDVCLVGEAFFDVKHNPKLPFIVYTKAMKVKALGTAFNVKAYKNEAITETALMNGIVEVTLREDRNTKLLLYPNEKICWQNLAVANTESKTSAPSNKQISTLQSPVGNHQKQKIETNSDGLVKEIAWKANKLVFEDESFEEIAVLLERWYAVKINFKDNELRNYRFTGIFQQEELSTVLDFLKESRSFNYTSENDEFLTINLYK